jgi:NAD(P)-dependent dehydrogenase (short-subunit alcohol dehydrogenase family)
MTTQRHLILGGSDGIGKAYAMYYAKEGHALDIVARHSGRLNAARNQLIRAGSSSVSVHEGDVLQHTFRSLLLDELCPPYSSILIGGPSPPAGLLDDLNEDALRRGMEVLYLYPFEIASWAFRQALSERGRLILLSSSAVDEPLCSHPFFISALFRRSLHQLLECMAQRSNRALRIWKPQVVATTLAKAYAIRAIDQSDPGKIDEFLKRQFDVKNIATPEEWVLSMLKGADIND